MATTNNRSSGSDKTPRPAKDIALGLLARREHSLGELRQKLRQRGYASDEIDQALTELASDGYQSEARAAQARINAGLRRGHGPQRIRAALGAASLGKAEVAIDPDVDWLQRARELLTRKFGEEPPAEAKEYARRARFLQARGYESEVIRKALRD